MRGGVIVIAGEFEGIIRANVAALLPPRIGDLMAVRVHDHGVAADPPALKSAVQAFILAMGLKRVEFALWNGDAQTDQ